MERSQQSRTEAHLLVVDDEPNIRDLLASSLRFAGFEVSIAGDGNGALKTVEKTSPDLVVLDVMLPDMDGFTVARRLRERDVTTPILFLTARDDMADKVQGLTVGGDDYVTKPFGLEEVIARIRAILRRTQRITPVHKAPTSTDSAGARPSVIHGRARKACGPYSCGSHRENRKHTLTIQNTFHVASRLVDAQLMKKPSPAPPRGPPTKRSTSSHVMTFSFTPPARCVSSRWPGRCQLRQTPHRLSGSR